jgi:hypothetical protein
MHSDAAILKILRSVKAFQAGEVALKALAMHSAGYAGSISFLGWSGWTGSDKRSGTPEILSPCRAERCRVLNCGGVPWPGLTTTLGNFCVEPPW